MAKSITDITDDQITSTAKAILEAIQGAEHGRTSYLRHLITATQAALGGKRNQETLAQLTALAKVHQRFYELVMHEAERYVPAGTKDRQVELHRKANFARTALSAVRGHIKSGADVVALNPEKATKASLTAYQRPDAPVSAKRLVSRAERFGKALLSTITALTAADPNAAAEEIRQVMEKLREQLEAIEPDAPARRSTKPEAQLRAPQGLETRVVPNNHRGRKPPFKPAQPAPIAEALLS